MDQVVMVLFARENRGESALHRPKARFDDESLVLSYPCLQQRCSLHPCHPSNPVGAEQSGDNLPIGADPSEAVCLYS